LGLPNSHFKRTQATDVGISYGETLDKTNYTTIKRRNQGDWDIWFGIDTFLEMETEARKYL